MQLFTLQSKLQQVAEAIKEQILSGKVEAGTKLSSVRDLASSFKVSTKTIVRALDILEEESLISREAGRGIFIRPYSANSNIEVCMIAWNVNFASDPYFSSLVKISYPPYLQNGFNFTIRTVPFSPEATTNHFAQELQKFDRNHADCLIIHAPNLDAAKIRTCLQLKTPVIFIGDFSHGLDPDIPFNQVTDDNTVFGENLVKKLVSGKKTDEIILYTPSREHYFCRMCCNGVTNVAKDLKIQLHIIEMPKGFSRLSPEQQEKIFSQKTKETGVRDLRSALALNGGMSNDFLKGHIDLGTACPNIYYHSNSKPHLLKFYNTIFSEIERIVKDPNSNRKMILKEDFDNFILNQI